jgi:nitroimidazol reductase NimA-like FMN-containing flavoprotein (pyridoxamine 5'-phosphate oxidase superfamily)
MMDCKLDNELKNLLMNQKLGVLSTSSNNEPYANIVAFASTPDMSEIIFITPRDSKKYRNLCSVPRSAILIDNTANLDSDFKNAMAVTATGQTIEISDDLDKYLSIYCSKHPDLKDFSQKADSAVFRLEIEKYYFVKNFQEVKIIDMSNVKGNGEV